MLTRRMFFKSFAITLGSLLYNPITSLASTKKYTLPIIMLHKIVDNPQRPEDISPNELFELFTYLFENNFRPVSLSDIIQNQNEIENIFINGFRPFAITVDDADPSVLFSKNNAYSFDIDKEMPNRFSFLEIYCKSANFFQITPKANFFLSESIAGVYDKLNQKKASKPTNKYFGGFLSLPSIVDLLDKYSGIELGYHTCEHIFMRNKNAEETYEILEMQMTAFKTLGIFDRIKQIFAYPYGVPPSQEGMQVMKKLGFIGAVLAFPGVHEAKYKTIPLCEMNTSHRLINDPFLIPRSNIGSIMYAPTNPENIPYRSINPIKDFQKDFSL